MIDAWFGRAFRAGQVPGIEPNVQKPAVLVSDRRGTLAVSAFSVIGVLPPVKEGAVAIKAI